LRYRVPAARAARPLRFLDVRLLRLSEAKAVLRALQRGFEAWQIDLQQHVAGLDRREALATRRRSLLLTKADIVRSAKLSCGTGGVRLSLG
jgi:hypothetical protein